MFLETELDATSNATNEANAPFAEQWRIMIVAGEPSGDALAASLVGALRRQAHHSHFDIFGACGARLRGAGAEEIVRADDLAITGLIEAGRALPHFWRAYQTLKRAALERRPDAVVLVDWPDFNLPLARALHRRGLKVIYYVSPQLWAWRAHRVRQIRRDVDLLLAVLPFEPAWYARRGVSHVKFVGHPLTSEVVPQNNRAEVCARFNLDPKQHTIALLPGSRRQELARNLPLMLDAATLILRSQPRAQFVIALASNRSTGEVAPLIREAEARAGHSVRLPEAIRLVEHSTRDALQAADAAAVASGTATLEAALTQTPLVIVYKESALNWHTLGRLINTEHYGLVNLIAEQRIVTELMQNDFTGASLARELTRLLDPECNRAMRARLRQATARLGTHDAAARAADMVLAALRTWSHQA